MELNSEPMRVIFAAIGISLSAIAPTSFGQTGAEGLSLAPGILVDPVNGLAYVMSPRRQIDAVRIENGEVVWSSAAAAKPLAIRGDRIIAQVDNPEASSTLTLAALDVDSGALVGSDSTDLGPDVIVSIDEGQGRQFVIGTGDADTANGPVLWRYFEQKLRGPEETPAPELERFGALSVSETASMAPVTDGGFSRQSGRPPYALPRISRPVSQQPPADAIILDLESGLRYRLDGVQVRSAEGDAAAGTTSLDSPTDAVMTRPPTGGLIVTEGRDGEEFPPIRRIPGDQFANSIDDRHIAASEFAGKIDAAEPYRWTIYERGTFDVVATFLARTSLAPFIVAGDRILYLRQPFERREGETLQSYLPALIARDAKSGRIAWTHSVRDTRYQGPIPDQAK